MIHFEDKREGLMWSGICFPLCNVSDNVIALFVMVIITITISITLIIIIKIIMKRFSTAPFPHKQMSSKRLRYSLTLRDTPGHLWPRQFGIKK